MLWQEDKSSNRLRAGNLITADSGEEGRVRGRETQSQLRKKGPPWLNRKCCAVHYMCDVK